MLTRIQQKLTTLTTPTPNEVAAWSPSDEASVTRDKAGRFGKKGGGAKKKDEFKVGARVSDRDTGDVGTVDHVHDDDYVTVKWDAGTSQKIRKSNLEPHEEESLDQPEKDDLGEAAKKDREVSSFIESMPSSTDRDLRRKNRLYEAYREWTKTGNPAAEKKMDELLEKERTRDPQADVRKDARRQAKAKPKELTAKEERKKELTGWLMESGGGEERKKWQAELDELNGKPAAPKKKEPYKPQGRTDESSYDYTDDPKQLAFRPREELEQALRDDDDPVMLKFDYEEWVPRQAVEEALEIQKRQGSRRSGYYGEASDDDRRLVAVTHETLIGVLAQHAGRPWALQTEAMEVLLSADPTMAVELQVPVAPDPVAVTADGTAIVPLHGVLTPRSSGVLGQLLGAGGGLGAFSQQLIEAARSDTVKRIVLDVNSPGGLTDQIPETAALIRKVREHKPVTAVANTKAASAAYWLASQADEVVVTPSGEVGSLGVYMVHADASAALEKAGVDVTLTSAGKFKTEGNQFEPLTPEAKTARQEKVERMYSMFIDDVAEGREASSRRVRNSYGEGRTLLAGEAAAAGLVDRVATIEDVVAEPPAAVAKPAIDHRREMAALEF